MAVDEGLDRLFRWDPAGDRMVWTMALPTKCRSLQRISESRLLVVNSEGYFEVDLNDGAVLRSVRLDSEGVLSVSRVHSVNTFVAGLNLARHRGLTFLELDEWDRPHRQVVFPGDYLRTSTLTDDDTILFTNNTRVFEGDWSGRILREFAAPRFQHAWKALRRPNGNTMISAGYGAFLVEFDSAVQEIRRWQCEPDASLVRPNFFADFTIRDDGGVIVCNWLGHGGDLGATGYPLLEFNPAGELVGGWQDGERTSSIQTFVMLER